MRSIRDTLERFDAMPAKQKRENSHIPLVMFGLAKRAAIDVRLINPDLPDEPGSKVNNAVREILADLKSTDHYKGYRSYLLRFLPKPRPAVQCL